jgi:hypothetical protein
MEVRHVNPHTRHNRPDGFGTSRRMFGDGQCCGELLVTVKP